MQFSRCSRFGPLGERVAPSTDSCNMRHYFFKLCFFYGILIIYERFNIKYYNKFAHRKWVMSQKSPACIILQPPAGQRRGTENHVLAFFLFIISGFFGRIASRFNLINVTIISYWCQSVVRSGSRKSDAQKSIRKMYDMTWTRRKSFSIINNNNNFPPASNYRGPVKETYF